MPRYHKLGTIPPKRHTIFKSPEGKFYYEELFGTIGFDGMSSLLYHTHRPTQVKEVLKSYDVSPKIAVEKNMKALSLKGFEVPAITDYLESRKIILANSDCYIALAAPKKSLRDYFYKNTDSDEVLFIHKGTGKLRTFLGNIDFEYGDYLVIPRGMIYQIDFDTEDNRLFIVESKHPVYTPKRYRNWFGQHLEYSPYCERDMHPPSELETFTDAGDFILKVKKQVLWGGMVIIIHINSQFTILNLLLVVCINHHQCIKLLKQVLSSFVHLYQDCMIIIHNRYLHLTIIAI